MDIVKNKKVAKIITDDAIEIANMALDLAKMDRMKTCFLIKMRKDVDKIKESLREKYNEITI